MAIFRKLLCAGLATALLTSPSLFSSQAFAQDADDPLARFEKKATAPQNGTPLPTPGGFQEATTEQQLTFEAMQLEGQLSIEEQQAELERKTRDAAYDAALNSLMPMKPDEILRLLDHYKKTRKAAEKRLGGQPTPEVTIETISLDPGAVPPTVKLSPGHVTSVNILDITGQPWPVQNVSWGGNFEIISPEAGGHIIKISPMKAHEVGNMSVQLLGLKTPVTFTLTTNLEVVQYRFDAQIPEYGPYADMPIIDPGITTVAGNGTLTSVLQGLLPSGAKRLSVSGVDGRTSVYRMQDTTYVRTPLSLLSPGWTQSARSADGTTVYVINNSPVLLLSDRGKMVRASIQEDKE